MATAAAAEKAGFKNWEQVSGHIPPTDKLFRSGAPHYYGPDDHHLDVTAINFLKTSGIKHVISLNSKAKTNTEIETDLRGAGIAYTPLPVTDFTAPTLEQLSTGNTEYEKHRDGTLVWCGFGHGRTGTMITGLQIYAIKHKKPRPRLGRPDYKKNHVEERHEGKSTGQYEVLNTLQDTLPN